jgi:hypothetical protein
MERLEEAIKAALAKRGLKFTLKKEQFECISPMVLNDRDVLAVFNTNWLWEITDFPAITRHI